MPRNEVDTCFLCGESPCVCNKKKSPKPRTKPRPKKQPEAQEAAPTSAGKRSAVGAMKARAASQPERPKAVQPEPRKHKFTPTPEKLDPEVEEVLQDPQMVLAIQYLGDMLAPDEKRRLKKILTHDTGTLRAKAWRERRNESLGASD
jgi:hypothetical protein